VPVAVLVAVNVAVDTGVLVAVFTGVLVRVNVNVLTGLFVGVFTGVFVRVNVAVIKGVLVTVRVNVGIAVLVYVNVVPGVRDCVKVGDMATDVNKTTLSISMSSAPLALLDHCSAVMAFFVNVEAAPKPRCASDTAFMGTVTSVHAAGAVKETPNWSPSVIDGCTNWNQYDPPLPLT